MKSFVSSSQFCHFSSISCLAGAEKIEDYFQMVQCYKIKPYLFISDIAGHDIFRPRSCSSRITVCGLGSIGRK